jgi:dTDP-glucose 4,6-dehydratase
MTSPTRIFIAGGAGFIGSQYVRSLLSDGLSQQEVDRVTVYDKLTYAGNRRNLEPIEHDSRFNFVQGDICDATGLRQHVRNHDLVVNFAAETHVDRSIAGPQEFIRTNILGLQMLLDTCLEHDIETVIHIGTDEVYGSIDTGRWDEDSPLRPNSPYSASKAGAELLARAYFRTYGLDVRTTRCSNNYGPYQYPEKVIPLFITNLIMGKKLPLYGDGSNVRDWIHVEDHCRGIQVVAERGQAGCSYNIGGQTELTNRELASLILDLMGADESAIELVPDRPGHDFRYAMDDSLIRSLGFAPEVRFEEGLATTVDWYRRHEGWWRPLREIEQQS